MKNLIVSLDTYSWIRYCSATIMRDPSTFEVIIIRYDSDKPIYNCPQLCRNAVYEQRKSDLFRIGKELGIRRLYNLNYPEDFDIEKLTVELQLRVGLGFTQRIYHQHDKILSDIFDKIRQKTNIEIYSYGKGYFGHQREVRIRNVLSADEAAAKMNLRKLMIGISDTKELEFPLIVERFFT